MTLWWRFSDTVRTFLDQHSIEVEAMRARRQFQCGRTATNSPAMWFDRDSYGVDGVRVALDGLLGPAGFKARRVAGPSGLRPNYGILCPGPVAR